MTEERNYYKKIASDIANKILDVDSLETKNSDSSDFHDVSVWGIKEALIQAIKKGEEIEQNRKYSQRSIFK